MAKFEYSFVSQKFSSAQPLYLASRKSASRRECVGNLTEPPLPSYILDGSNYFDRIFVTAVKSAYCNITWAHFKGLLQT